MSGLKKEISIVAGGWSFSPAWAERLPGEVIGVNDAGRILGLRGVCRQAITMDRLLLEDRLPQFQAMFNDPKLSFETLYARRSALQNIKDIPEFVTPFENDHTTADFAETRRLNEPLRLNGTNSGLCALNLAYLMSPSRVYLFGFDMNRSPDGRPYWYADYPWAKGGATKEGTYRAWAAELSIAQRRFAERRIHVFNCSLTSAVTAFDRVAPEDVLK